MEQLERTRTNSATDSKGHAFGLAGNLFIYPIVGLVLALGLIMFCFSLLGLNIFASVVLGIPVFLAPIIYIYGLRHNKPRGYDRDWFDNLFSVNGFSLVKANQPRNPRYLKDE